MGSFGAGNTSWILSCATPSLSGTNCELFRTRDAGHQWYRVSSFPVVGLIPNGITMMGTDGWITGQNHSDHAAEVLLTHDGGHTWSTVPLVIPAGAATNADTDPVISYATTVLLPAVLYEKQGAGFLLYEAIDGVFRPTAPLSTTASPTAGGRSTLRYSVASRAVTYVLASPSLYRTANAGRSWDMVNAHVPAWTVVDFVTPAVGYSVNGPTANRTPPILWTTTDGGENWMRVLYKVKGPSPP
jgi:hypothetical protein